MPLRYSAVKKNEMNSFESLLNQFNDVLRKQNPIEYNKLLPPTSNFEIEKNLEELNIIDKNLTELYEWKGGRKKNSDCQICECGSLLSFTDIKEMIDLGVTETFDEMLKPIFSDGDASVLLLFNTTIGANYGKIYFYSIPDLYIDHPISYYDSLTSMLETWLEAYNKKIFRYDYDLNTFNFDYHDFIEIAKKLNKTSIYWKKHDPLKWEEWYKL